MNRNDGMLGFSLMLCAFFCTSPILSIIINGMVLSFYSLFFFTSVLLMFVKSKGVALVGDKEKNMLVGWLIGGCMSCLIGMIYYVDDPLWFNNNVSFLLKTIMYLVFTVLFVNTCNSPFCIFKGLELGAVVNIIWAGIDAVYYYIFHSSLTNKLFSSYIIAANVRHGSIDTFEGGLIRPAGFNTDPASIGLFAPFVLLVGLIQKKYWMVVLALLSFLFSGSNTSFVCCIVGCIVYVSFFANRKARISLSIKKLFFFWGGVIILGVVGFKYGDFFIDRFAQIDERVHSVYGGQSNDVENLRNVYVMQLPKVIFYQNFKVLTGTGFNTSSEGFLLGDVNSKNLKSRLVKPFDIENLYIAYFFDNGIFVFAVFICMLWGMLKKTKKIVMASRSEESTLAFSALIAVVSSSLFYHYTLYSFHILLWCSICIMSLNNIRLPREGANV